MTVSFTCSDALSGIKSCSGATTLTGSAATQVITGTAADNADNTATAAVGNINIDKAPPTLSGSPTTQPNAAGWYNGDVTIHWTASDALSGVDPATMPKDSVIGGAGTGMTASATVADKAGNTSPVISSPAVKIDRVSPATALKAPPAWNNTDVTVDLVGSDNLSGVKATHYKLDGGADQTGTSVTINTQGVHTLQYWSADNADNVEPARSATINIDKTPPSISHTQTPAANAKGWNNANVTVTFTCADQSGLSGIANCTAPQTVTTEGKDQPVTGTATDNAGNTVSDPANINLDKTKPSVNPVRDRLANPAGWYNDDVIVSFTCLDKMPLANPS